MKHPGQWWPTFVCPIWACLIGRWPCHLWAIKWWPVMNQKWERTTWIINLHIYPNMNINSIYHQKIEKHCYSPPLTVYTKSIRNKTRKILENTQCFRIFIFILVIWHLSFFNNTCYHSFKTRSSQTSRSRAVTGPCFKKNKKIKNLVWPGWPGKTQLKFLLRLVDFFLLK